MFALKGLSGKKISTPLTWFRETNYVSWISDPVVVPVLEAGSSGSHLFPEPCLSILSTAHFLWDSERKTRFSWTSHVPGMDAQAFQSLQSTLNLRLALLYGLCDGGSRTLALQPKCPESLSWEEL